VPHGPLNHSVRCNPCLRAQSSKLYHLGIPSAAARNTLANANAVRDWRIYADFAQSLIGIARPLYDGTMLGRMLRFTESHAINAFRAIRTQVRFDEFDGIVGSFNQILDELRLYFWGPVGSVEFRITVLH
jgi:hypothetical protein